MENSLLLFRRFIVLALAYLFAGSPKLVQADFYIHSWQGIREQKGRYDFHFDIAYFYTNSNYTSYGGVSKPAGLDHYNRIQNDILGVYGITDRLSVFGRLSWAYLQIASDILPGNAYGFTDQSLGFNYRVFQNQKTRTSSSIWPIGIDFQLQSDIPAYSVPSKTFPMGDGSVDVTAGAFLSLPIFQDDAHAFGFLGGMGYTYRTQGYSSALPWSIMFKYFPKRDGVFLDVSFLGLTSLNTDKNSTNSLISDSAGSSITGAINPSVVQFRGRIGLKVGHEFQMHLSGSQSIWGRAAPSNYQLALGLQIFLGRKVSHSNPTRMTPSEYGQANAGFIHYSLDAQVLDSNSELTLVKINKGSQDGVEVGQIFDIFSVTPNGTEDVAVARGVITEVHPNLSTLRITDHYTRNVGIEEGFLAKRLIQ